MERAQGELGHTFDSKAGLASTAVVLGADGSFLEAQKLRMPEESDLTIFQRLAEGVDGIENYGFCLPDPVLLNEARSILDGLAEGTEASEEAYLGRLDGGPESFMGDSVKKQRLAGREFSWSRFSGGCCGDLKPMGLSA